MKKFISTGILRLILEDYELSSSEDTTFNIILETFVKILLKETGLLHINLLFESIQKEPDWTLELLLNIQKLYDENHTDSQHVKGKFVTYTMFHYFIPSRSRTVHVCTFRFKNIILYSGSIGKKGRPDRSRLSDNVRF